MTPNNDVVHFLLNNSAPCEKWVCTTCGGRLDFLIRLRKVFPSDDVLAENLKKLKGSDIAQMRNDQNCMPQVLNILPAAMRKSVFEVWMKNIMNDPDLAIAVLLWTEYGKTLSQNMMHDLLEAAETRLVLSHNLRDNLRKSLHPETELPSRLKSFIEKDIQEEEEKLQQPYIAAKERNDYLNGLSFMSFCERVLRILSDQSIKYQNWREEWSLCTDEDIEKLDASDVQKLIDLCETNQSYRWTEALKKLYDKRHQLRYETIDRFKQQHGHLSPQEQLFLLIRSRVPIEHYPVELAQYITLQWMETVSKQERNYILELLSHTRLRVWKKVRERFRNDNQNA